METQEEFHQPLNKFHRKYGSLDKGSFLEVFRLPFLVFTLPSDKTLPEIFPSESAFPVARQATRFFDHDPAERSRLIVACLEKSARNQDRRGITIGRACDNDIVIPHESVSKHHALIRVGPLGVPRLLYDDGSRFGTVARSRKLADGRFHTLRSGDTVVLGEAVFGRYLSAFDFFDYMVRRDPWSEPATGPGKSRITLM